MEEGGIGWEEDGKKDERRWKTGGRYVEDCGCQEVAIKAM